MEEELAGFWVSCLIPCLPCQFFEFRGILVDKGKFELQLLEVIPCSVFLRRILEPFSERVQEVFPDYWAIIVCGVQGVEEFAKVSNPASYLFPFDICEGESGPSDVRLVRGDCPI